MLFLCMLFFVKLIGQNKNVPHSEMSPVPPGVSLLQLQTERQQCALCQKALTSFLRKVLPQTSTLDTARLHAYNYFWEILNYYFIPSKILRNKENRCLIPSPDYPQISRVPTD